MADPNNTIIKEFLIKPHNRRAFNDFYKLCYNFTIGYLYYLKKINYKLPYDNRTDKDPIEDLAIDILGYFLASKKDKPFFAIFNYFSQHKVTNFDIQSPEILNDMLVILLKGFIKKRLYKIKASTSPQVENLKKRFKDIFSNSGKFELKNINNIEHIYSKSENTNLRENNSLIPYCDLEEIVLKSFYESNNRSQWCFNIFENIKRETKYKNMVSKYLLLTAVVKINAEYIDSGEFLIHKVSSAKNTLINKSIVSAFEIALDKLKAEILFAYLKKRVISLDESELLHLACRNYLIDYCNHGGDTDPIPVYFREMMPLETHERYLKDYKNIFESSIKKMMNIFKEELRKSSTIQKLGYY